MIGDVVVFGVTMGDHVLEDIGVNVPQGIVVTVPAELALRSRDLWRAISLKQVMRLQVGLQNTMQAPQIAPTMQASVQEADNLAERNAQLHQELEAQRSQTREALNQNQVVLEQLRAQGEQLRLQGDVLRALLSQGVPSVPYAPPSQSSSSQSPTLQTTRRDDSVPTYIPSTIKPEAVEIHIEAQVEESKSDISGARSKLRKFRQ